MKPRSQVLAEALASARASVTALESKLSVSVLYGSGYMILARHPGGFDVVLGSFDRPGHYAVNAPRCFVSLGLVPDHLCGVSLWPIEDAQRNIEGLKKDPMLAELTGFTVRHIRDEQTRRLTDARAMVAVLEALPTND